MDGRRLDELAKVLAARRSRRGMVRVLGASLAGSLAGALGHHRPAAAQQQSSIRQSDETAAGFETCGGGACREPKTQLQNRPYQVWCTAAPKTNSSAGCADSGCRCHLYWREKPDGAWEHAADQNVKKNIRDKDDVYTSRWDYECRCQKAKADGSSTVDDAALPLPNLASAFVLPEGFALDQGAMVFDPAALAEPGFDPQMPGFLVGFQATTSLCPDDGPCDVVRITAIAHTDDAAASAKTEAVFYGLPGNAVNVTGAYLLGGVGQSQFTATYPIEDESGPRDVVHLGFHVGELSGEVIGTGGGSMIDVARSVAEEVIVTFSKIPARTPLPDASSLMLRFQGEFSCLVVPLVENEVPIPLAGRTADEQAIYNKEFVSALYGLRFRHEVPDVEGAPALIVINTVLQMPDLEAAQAYLNQWPGLYQEVLDLQGIVGEVIDPPVLLGDEGFHSAFAFTLATGDGNGVDGLNLAGLFQGPTSTWFASVSLRTTKPRILTLEDPFSVERLLADLRAIAGSGFISAYDSLVRGALNAGTDYPRALLPPVPMPDLTAAPAEAE